MDGEAEKKIEETRGKTELSKKRENNKKNRRRKWKEIADMKEYQRWREFCGLTLSHK